MERRSFYGIPELKENYLGRIAMHREMDHLVQGKTWETNGETRGCAIGCTFENYNHQDMEDQWQVPIVLAKLEDCIFEGLPQNKAMEWPYRFCEAIPVGKNLSLVWPKFALWIVNDELRQYSKDTQFIKALDMVETVYERWVLGEDITTADFRSAAGDAAGDARAAVRAAAGDAWAARDAVRATAWAAGDATRAAAWAAAGAATWAARAAGDAARAARAARDAARAAAWAAWIRMADKLIEIIDEQAV